VSSYKPFTINPYGNMYVEDVTGLSEGDIVTVKVSQGFAYDVVVETI